jgi:hypothetical protein
MSKEHTMSTTHATVTYEQGGPSGVKGSSHHAYVVVNGWRVPGYLHIDHGYQWWAVNAAGIFHGPFVSKNAAARELVAQESS